MRKSFWVFISGIIYTYFGYPLIITILSRIFPQKRAYSDEYPSVSLIIAAYNEERVIKEKIQNSLEIDYPQYLLQIIIITDGSDDDTVNITKNYINQGIELLHQPARNGKMAAINRAMPYARGDIIIFSDANNFYQANTIKELVKPFSDPEVGAVSGAKGIIQGDGSLGESEGLYWKYESIIKEAEDRFSSCTSAAAEILACRRCLYTNPPDNIINDDFYQVMLILRQGYRVAYSSNANSFERVSISAEHEIKRRTRIVAGRYQAISNAGRLLPFDRPVLVWQIVSHKFMRPLVPFFMIGAAVTNIYAVLIKPGNGTPKNQVLNLKPPFNYTFFLIQSVFYTIAWFGKRYENLRGANLLEKIFYLPTFIVNSNIAALRGFGMYIQGKQSNLWERMPRR